MAHCVSHEGVHVVSQVPPVGVLHDDGQVLPSQEHLSQLHDVGVGSAQQLVLRTPARPARVASRRCRLCRRRLTVAETDHGRLRRVEMHAMIHVNSVVAIPPRGRTP